MGVPALRWLRVVALTLAVAELADSVVIAVENYADAQPGFAVLFAVLFFVGWWLLRRRRQTIGATLVGLLCVFEVLSAPTWIRHNAFDWVTQLAVVAVAVAGIGLALVVLVTRPGARRVDSAEASRAA